MHEKHYFFKIDKLIVLLSLFPSSYPMIIQLEHDMLFMTLKCKQTPAQQCGIYLRRKGMEIG